MEEQSLSGVVVVDLYHHQMKGKEVEYLKE